MMSLADSVKLVLYAFNNAGPGDIFVQKAPATKVITLAMAMKEIFNAGNEIEIIGARHGEKMFETLCSREEMAKAEDLGDFYRIPADLRDLNYTRYVQTRGKRLTNTEYTSESTRQLELDEMKELLLSLDFIRAELAK
jgi:UDP-N-acetylglucosamine 4,6-dehydratase/5-epimerase